MLVCTSMYGSNATRQVSAKKRQIGLAKGVTVEEREEARKNASKASRKKGRMKIGKKRKEEQKKNM